jgi:DNA-binding NarL/FixJ family response regulator
MKDLILLIGDDGGTDRRLLDALARTAPAFHVERVDERAGIETLHIPAVILLDLKLSKQPAFEILRWLRSDHRYQRLPVFVLASETANHNVNEAYALGANSCFLTDEAGERLEHIAEGIAAYVSLMPLLDCAASG